MKENTLIVSHKESVDAPLMPTREVRITNTNWISGPAPLRKKISARMRYRQALMSCKVGQDADGFSWNLIPIKALFRPGNRLFFIMRENVWVGQWWSKNKAN